MKELFDSISYACSKHITRQYSTSFSMAVRLLGANIRADIYNIYGFVRLADEIVDSFHDYDKLSLLDRFEEDLALSLQVGISTNPILNAFQHTVRKHQIDHELIYAFMKSMRMDLSHQNYTNEEDYNTYIYGSADVVGLMCLTVFVQGDKEVYERLKPAAIKLGSAFQKVNFLRDLRDDMEGLNRSYFPDLEFGSLDNSSKNKIILEIEEDFAAAYKGILSLPSEAKFGVYTAYRYYQGLLNKLKHTPSDQIMQTRIRIPNTIKMGMLAKSYFNVKFNLL